jgi:hypothetical protein
MRVHQTSQGGFGQWFSDIQQQESEAQTPEVDESVWSSLWTSSSEKKSDGDPESQGFLDQATNWLETVQKTVVDSTGLAQPQETTLFGLSYQTRFKGFVATVMLSGFFFFMAFIIGLPVVVIRPSKFALCFTVGSIMYMSSFALLKGPEVHLRSMMSRERLPFSAAYVGSMMLTLYAALVARSYILVILTSSLQISTLAYYMLSFIPGGSTGARIFISMFVRSARLALSATYTIFMGCLRMANS